MLVFKEGGKPGGPGAWTRTKNKLNPHTHCMTPGPGIEPGPHWWEASTLTTAPSPLPQLASKVSSTLGVRAFDSCSSSHKLTSSQCCARAHSTLSVPSFSQFWVFTSVLFSLFSNFWGCFFRFLNVLLYWWCHFEKFLWSVVPSTASWITDLLAICINKPISYFSRLRTDSFSSFLIFNSVRGTRIFPARASDLRGKGRLFAVYFFPCALRPQHTDSVPQENAGTTADSCSDRCWCPSTVPGPRGELF